MNWLAFTVSLIPRGREFELLFRRQDENVDNCRDNLVFESPPDDVSVKIRDDDVKGRIAAAQVKIARGGSVPDAERDGNRFPCSYARWQYEQEIQ